MKFSHYAAIGAACLAFTAGTIAGSTDAFAQDSGGKKTRITVLRTDTTLDNAGKLLENIQTAISNEVKDMGDKYELVVKDITYSDVQFATGCMEFGDSDRAAECYKQASRLKKIGEESTGFNDSDIVVSSYDENGETQIVWYKAQEDSYKYVSGKVWNEKSAEDLVRGLFVRKLVVLMPDATAEGLSSDVMALHEALLRYARNTKYLVDEKQSEKAYSEIQMQTECEDVGNSKAANMCYILASAELQAEEFIFSTIDAGGETQIIWYGEGSKGIHVYRGKVTDLDSAEQLAKDIFIGKVGFLKVVSNVPGASVVVAGKRIGMTGEFENSAPVIELVARDEPYEVTVREKGYSKEEAQRVFIEEGETRTIRVNMAKLTDPEEIRKAVKIAGYATLGAGAAAVIVGGVLYALGDSKNNDVSNKIKSGDATYDYKGNKSSADGMLTGAVASFGVGGFLLVAGGVLTALGFLYDFSYESYEDSGVAAMPKVDFRVSPEYQGLTLGWTF